MKSLFQEDASDKQRKLADLKKKIRATQSVIEYQPSFGRTDAATIQLADLDKFGEQFLQDTWTIIDEKYPYDPTPPDPVQLERYG